ncbi:hypothetical protein NY2A_B575R [Paramecium bursaria Chlorella virus NY2A]|uniref:Uncharacterized protein B575R n=1 Tax=Paramecium bursaria Chlorella virus NY2A TaxID=46021 RepID=A7IXA0_PBCVN|nr:hypothetical protein NY2A_B575R [Paramecium bursaria Chlorella virus NY2A]ABT14974.1 hypothetical protein NY2A_B575R [Paramecium bursaria Chlorella virus NY2A]
MNTKTLILIVGVCIALAVSIYLFMNMKRKETWYSRTRDDNAANSKIWNATVAKGLKGIAEENEELRKMYPYLGYGDFTGMVCKGPNNVGCTAYSNYTR